MKYTTLPYPIFFLILKGSVPLLINKETCGTGLITMALQAKLLKQGFPKP